MTTANSKSFLAVLLAFVLLLGSCASTRQPTGNGSLSDNNGTGVRKTGSLNRTEKGGIVGAGGGAVVGGILGSILGGGRGTAAGAILGAAVGGGAGGPHRPQDGQASCRLAARYGQR